MKPPKITGKQVGLLIAMMIERSIHGERRQLEWLEDEASVNVIRFEDIDISQFNVILHRLREISTD